jgi:7-carboxy-7-deazaguanine synthase
MSTVAPVKTKVFPVVETFGPTVQGEGILAGLSTYFVRFGGCDYRCSWCDSLHAVLPAQVKANSEMLSADQILRAIQAMPEGPEWVTLSGGNPAMLKLDELVTLLQANALRVSVETQGSLWKPWLGNVNSLTISPKPPSSGMADKVEKDLAGFMFEASLSRPRRTRDALKVVVFDEDDFEFACSVFATYMTWPRFVSCGTVVGEPLQDLSDRYRWLCERVSTDKRLMQVRALPQLHVVAWGHARGV